MPRNEIRETICYDDIIRDSEDSILFSFGYIEEWLPRSQIQVDFDDNMVEAPMWLIEDRGLEGYIAH